MRSILLIKISSLGDIVHNLPVASDIHARFPEASIDWVVEESFAALPRLHPAVHRVLPVALRRWRGSLWSPETWQQIASFKRSLQSQRYDLVLDTQGLVKSALIARLAHGRRAGNAAETAREPLAARFYDSTYAIPQNQHAVARYRWLAAAALDYTPDFEDSMPLDYGITAAPLVAPWLPPRPYALLLTATSRADKLWPEPDWLALGAALHARGLSCVLPAGSAEERERAQRLAAGMARAVVAPALALDAMAQLIAGAAIVVGVDTGLTHLAAALNRPVVALFCSTDPVQTGVYATANAVNLGDIGAPPSADVVIATVASLLI